MMAMEGQLGECSLQLFLWKLALVTHIRTVGDSFGFIGLI